MFPGVPQKRKFGFLFLSHKRGSLPAKTDKAEENSQKTFIPLVGVLIELLVDEVFLLRLHSLEIN